MLSIMSVAMLKSWILKSTHEKTRNINKTIQPIGFGILKTTKELGLKIPDDVSLIIFDNHPYLSLLNPAITTVKQDSEKINSGSDES